MPKITDQGDRKMCGICERIQMIKNGSNPYFVKELETGYVVIGDFQHFKGYTLFLNKGEQINNSICNSILCEE